MESIAIRASGVRASVGKWPVLHDVNCTLGAGRWTSVVGPNGAGKSTLLKALAGLLPYSGSIALHGESLATLGAGKRALQVAWLGQNETPGEDLMVYDVVMLGRLPHQPWLSGPSNADRAAVQEAMAATQCWSLRERSLHGLSGGERQRVLLARALAVQASILLMDEPLAHLDPPHQAAWLDTVRALLGAGKTVVSVLHELNMALQADDLLVLQQGRVVHQGACADSATHAAVSRVFEGRVEVHALNGQWIALPVRRSGAAQG
ncbi:MAG: ABC transporter ATP-binding protein [Rhodoferax sp.]|nr:ABC transporter ATP-binding protein [Rhodoferax sp.]